MRCSSELLSLDIVPKARGNFLKLTMLLFQIITILPQKSRYPVPVSITVCHIKDYKFGSVVSLPPHNFACPLCCYTQWPRDLKRGLVAAPLLGLRVRIPPGAWMSVVNVVCCQVELSASG